VGRSSILTLTFKSTNALSSGEKFYLVFPKNQVLKTEDLKFSFVKGVTIEVGHTLELEDGN